MAVLTLMTLETSKRFSTDLSLKGLNIELKIGRCIRRFQASKHVL